MRMKLNKLQRYFIELIPEHNSTFFVFIGIDCNRLSGLKYIWWQSCSKHKETGVSF